MKKSTGLLLLCLTLLSMPSLADPLYDALKDDIDIIVDIDGSGDYTTVQAAIDAVPNNSTDRTIVYIKKGRYYEKVRISSSKINLVLLGEDMDSTIITFDDYAQSDTNDDETVAIHANDFLALNITFENGYDKRDSQALAVTAYGDRQSFLHCRFNGYQDTYYARSDKRAYFKDCLIIGDVDFIYGSSTILFDSCQIHNVRSGAYYTAASTPESHKFGFVFKNCWLSTEQGVSDVWLGRPWRPYAHVAWLECYMDGGINPRGWNNWGDVANEATARYEEYNCTGPGADQTDRANWGKVLTDEQAATYTKANIYAKASNPSVSSDWLPDYEDDPIYVEVKKLTHKFLSPHFTDGRIKSLKFDGEPVADFHPDSLLVGIELTSGAASVPTLDPVLYSENSSFEITYPASLPAYALIDIKTRYNIQNLQYKVFFSVDSAFHNANLKVLEMYNEPVRGFSADDTTYVIGLDDDTPPFMRITAIPQIGQARLKIEYPPAVPGTFTFTVTAVDGYTKKTYYVDVFYGEVLGLGDDKESGIDFRHTNPVGDIMTGTISVKNPGQYNLYIYNTSGQLVQKHSLARVSTKNTSFWLDISELPQGLFIYRLFGEGSQQSGKLVK